MKLLVWFKNLGSYKWFIRDIRMEQSSIRDMINALEKIEKLIGEKARLSDIIYEANLVGMPLNDFLFQLKEFES